MAIKRQSLGSETSRPHKQTKLDFGQSSRPRPSTTKRGTSLTHKAEHSRPESKKSSEDNVEMTWEAPPKAKHGFALEERVGDIFDAPDGTVIIHACNCVGSWGAGIAAAFRKNYPQAFKSHQDHCKKSSPAQLIGTAQLIPPATNSKRKHWVGCLFTSKRYGRAKDSPQNILEATIPSMEDLVKQMGEVAGDIKEIRICQINSGLFAVPWKSSRAAIEGVEVDEKFGLPDNMIVYSLASK